MLAETKIDDTFPTSQFLIEGYSKPYRLDRNKPGLGILIFICEGMHCKLLLRHNLYQDIRRNICRS